VVCVQTEKIEVLNKNAANGQFLTDSATRKHGDMSHLDGRELQMADSSWLTETAAAIGNASPEKWDQFAANKQFGVRSTYDENIYTKRIDITR
jgi:PAB1-binding protein PBP1